jgi:hypothetical protein
MDKNRIKTRLCRLCKIDKPLDDYYKTNRTKDGRRSRCVACMTAGEKPGPKAADPMTRYTVNENGCWIWSGAIHVSGYGQIKWEGKSTVAHKVIYKLIKGQYDESLVLDHLCSVKSCVNPDHLEPVTYSVNTKRAWGRNHCLTCSCDK